MYSKKLFLILFFQLICSHPLHTLHVEWTVIGAGPGGISAISSLLANNINPKTILWIDEEFNAGRLGKFYSNVPGNVPAKNFLSFFFSCQDFKKHLGTSLQDLRSCNPEEHCSLRYIIKPLQAITNGFRKDIFSEQDRVIRLTRNKTTKQWDIKTKRGLVHKSTNVILAIGSQPKSLYYPGPQEIPLDIALDLKKLHQHIHPNDVVAVFGASHSAILVLEALSNVPIKTIINFYKKPLIYYIPFAGLKGQAAQWAKTVLEKNPPSNLFRFFASDEHVAKIIPQCTKVIYAIGYERNDTSFIPKISLTTFNPETGIIRNNLFGIGIAFPEEFIDSFGKTEKRIGILSFMHFAKKNVPLWIKMQKSRA